MSNTFKRPAGDIEKIITWKSKGLSDEIIKSPANSPAPKLKWIRNSKITV